MIVRYVSGALQRRSADWMPPVADAELSRRAELLILNASHEPWISKQGGFFVRSGVGIALLIDLIESENMRESDVDELISVAEKRSLLRTRRGRNTPEWSLISRLFPRTKTFEFAATGDRRRTGSAVGRWLLAYIVGDKVSIAAEKPKVTEDNVEVIEAAFRISVERRFRGRIEEQLAACTYRVHELIPHVGLDEIDAIIRAELAHSAPDRRVDDVHAAAVRLTSIRVILNELGLFDREIDELISLAEEKARARGYRPTPCGDARTA